MLLTVNGGSEQVNLNHSYVMGFTEDLTVRGLLKNSSVVQLTEDNKRCYPLVIILLLAMKFGR